MIDVRRVAESSLSSLENGLKTATNDAAIGLAVRWEYEHQSTDYFPLQISPPLSGKTNPIPIGS